MPLYEYQCKPCDHPFETLSRGAGDVARCPRCGSIDVVKLLSVPAAVRTGEGRKAELAGCAEPGRVPSFGCGRPQCGSGMCAGLG